MALGPEGISEKLGLRILPAFLYRDGGDRYFTNDDSPGYLGGIYVCHIGSEDIKRIDRSKDLIASHVETYRQGLEARARILERIDPVKALGQLLAVLGKGEINPLIDADPLYPIDGRKYYEEKLRMGSEVLPTNTDVVTSQEAALGKLPLIDFPKPLIKGAALTYSFPVLEDEYHYGKPNHRYDSFSDPFIGFGQRTYSVDSGKYYTGKKRVATKNWELSVEVNFGSLEDPFIQNISGSRYSRFVNRDIYGGSIDFFADHHSGSRHMQYPDFEAAIGGYPSENTHIPLKIWRRPDNLVVVLAERRHGFSEPKVWDTFRPTISHSELVDSIIEVGKKLKNQEALEDLLNPSGRV